MTILTDNVLRFPTRQSLVRRETNEVMQAAKVRWDLIRTRVRAMVIEFGGDEGACIEIEALTIEVMAEIGGKPFAAGVAEKVAARLRREENDGGAA